MSSLVPGLTRAGVGEVGSLENFVVLARRYGFGSVDTNGPEIDAWVGQVGLDQVRQTLGAQKVAVGCLGLRVDWAHSEAQFQAGLAALVNDAQSAASVGCTRCMTWAMPSTDQDPARHMVVTTRRLRTVAQVLGAYGLRLGIEFIGPAHMRTLSRFPLLWDIPGMVDWLGAIGEPNVGMVLDSFHWYTSGGTLGDIEGLSAQQIVHVHLNDARPGLVDEQRDNDRLFPGEGAIPLEAFLRALDRVGYSGAVAQEVLTPAPLTAPATDLLARSQGLYNRLFAAAGLV